jgi:hypothetical protein
MTKLAWQRRVTAPSAIAVANTHSFDHCLLAAQLKSILELALFRQVAPASLARICFVAPALPQREQACVAASQVAAPSGPTSQFPGAFGSALR